MSRRWSVFLDVDGTLLNDRGLAPKTAVDAVRAARANGHLVFLSTGRALCALTPTILGIGFDGVVSSSGAHVQVGHQVIADHYLTPTHIKAIVAYFERHGCEYILEGNDTMLGSGGARSVLRRQLFGNERRGDALSDLEAGMGAFAGAIVQGGDPFSSAFNKAVFLNLRVPPAELSQHFKGLLDCTFQAASAFGPESGELSLPGVSKASGMDAVLTHLHLDAGCTMALGDGPNDVKMLTHAAIGIAMRHASAVALDAADEVTATPDEAGVLEAFVRHGLVQRDRSVQRGSVQDSSEALTTRGAGQHGEPDAARPRPA